MRHATSHAGLALLAYKIGPNQFELNRDLTYISMRDQVLRARTLIHAAFGAGIFEKKNESENAFADGEVDYDVVVLGAGVGGISTALTAAEAGLRTLVLDAQPQCFSLLRAGTNRLLSTTVYDWPAIHFSSHCFPDIPELKPSPKKDAAILRFPSIPTEANTLADDLQRQLDVYAKKYASVLQIANNVKLNSHESVLAGSTRTLTVILPHDISVLGGAKKSIIRARIFIFAVGFGSEKVLIHTSDIRKTFWGYADLEKELKSLNPGRATAIIEGAGDGGLQECLRIAFKPDYHDLANAVTLLERKISAVSNDWHKLMLKILCAEDNAARAYMWGYDMHTVYKGLDEVHDSVIKHLLSSNKTLTAVIQWYKSVVREKELDINVVDKHPHPGRVYALNRFLVKLLIALTDAKHVDSVLVSLTAAPSSSAPDIGPICRSGIVQETGPQGTASKEDLLRHAVFRAIPNQYGVVR